MNTITPTRVLAVGFSLEECARVGNLCGSTEVLEAGSVRQVRELLRRVPDPGIDLLLVSTEAQTGNDAVLECLELRDQEALSEVPLLAAVPEHQTDVGHEVQQIKDSDFIVQPIEPRQFSEKLKALGIAPKAGEHHDTE